MITSIRCDAVRRAQRASECRVGSAQRKNNVTYAADDVSAVSVEFDVLIFANGGEAKLLDGDEVAVSNDLCSNCIGDYCDPGGWVGCKAYAERRHRGEHRGEVGDNDNFARELVIEVAGKATNHEEDKDCLQEAIIAKKAQELISCHMFADALAEHEQIYNGKSNKAADGCGVDCSAFLQTGCNGVDARAKNDTAFKGCRY